MSSTGTQKMQGRIRNVRDANIHKLCVIFASARTILPNASLVWVKV